MGIKLKTIVMDKYKTFFIALIFSTVIIYGLVSLLSVSGRFQDHTIRFFSAMVYCAPTIAAVFTINFYGEGKRKYIFFSRFRFTVRNTVFYLLAIVLPAFIGVCAVKLYCETVAGIPIFSESDFNLVFRESGLFLLAGAVFTEIGFRVYLMPDLSRMYSTFASGVFVGICQSIWMILLLFVFENPSFFILAALAVQYVLLSLLLGYISKFSKWEAGPAVLFQFCFYLTANVYRFSERQMLIIYSNMLMLFLIICFGLLERISANKKLPHK